MPEQTTAVAELKVTANVGIADEIFVCRYIPVSSVQEAHYEFYNVAYADQLHTVPTEPETKNRVCFVRRNSVTYYSESPLRAQNWCNEVYKEVQRLLQSYNVNYPLGSCDKVLLTEDNIQIVSGVVEDTEDPSENAASGVFLVTESDDGILRVPDGHYPVGIEYNDIIYRIQDMAHDIENSVFLINTESVRTEADISASVRDWKVWCFFGDEEGGDSLINTCGTDPRIVGTVVNATEAADGSIEIPDTSYPIGLEHNGNIYNVNEVIHDDDRNVFIIHTEEVRVLADFSGVKTYWRVWCVAKSPEKSCSDNTDTAVNGMIW